MLSSWRFVPLCAAKFKEFVKKEERVRKQLKIAVQKSSGSLEIQIQLDGNLPSTIRFVEKHLIDLQALISAETDEL